MNKKRVFNCINKNNYNQYHNKKINNNNIDVNQKKYSGHRNNFRKERNSQNYSGEK